MKTLGKYTNLERLGQGAMGVVYRAHDPSLGDVAIKVMSIDADGETHARERFVREARVAAALHHPNIIDVHGMGEHEGRPYIVMEFLEGEDLKSVVRRCDSVPLEHRVDIMKQVCSALAYAHATGVAHRDIKPENIFVTRSGQVRILDFGIARLPDSTMTATGALIGTPSYMAPEQVAGKKVDRRCDIFAAGTVFYEMLTGERAFAGRVDEVFEKITRLEPPPIHRLNNLVPLELSALISKAMAKDPEMRYQSMDEMVAQLEFFERSLSRLRDKARARAEATLDGEMQWVSDVSVASFDDYGRATLRAMANRVDEIRVQWPSEPAATQLAKRLLEELRRRIATPASLISGPSASSSGSGEAWLRT